MNLDIESIKQAISALGAALTVMKNIQVLCRDQALF